MKILMAMILFSSCATLFTPTAFYVADSIGNYTCKPAMGTGTIEAITDFFNGPNDMMKSLGFSECVYEEKSTDTTTVYCKRPMPYRQIMSSNMLKCIDFKNALPFGQRG
jgi:hypothetical protein